MHLLIFAQGDREQTVGVFETEEQAYEFVGAIPFATCETVVEDDLEFIYYMMEYENIPSYTAVEYNGWRVPISRFSYSESQVVDIFTREIPNYTIEGRGDLVEGETLVGGYYISNEDVGDYIESREELAAALMGHYLQSGYSVDRLGQTSQDGDLVVAYSSDGEMMEAEHLSPDKVLLYLQGGLERVLASHSEDNDESLPLF